MDIERIINNVYVERLYQHVYELEGVRHPIDNLDNLNKAADYIHTNLKEYGLSVREQEFKVEHFPATFRNIEGWIGNEFEPSIVLVSHYDTVYNDPGANDNAVSVSALLEIARILVKEKNVGTVRFLFSTLEEGNPAFELKNREIGQKWNITDDRNRYKSYQTAKILAQVYESWRKSYFMGRSSKRASDRILKRYKGQLPESILNYIKDFQAIYPDGTPVENIGKNSLIGSEVWVKEALNLGKKIKMVFCFDELGSVVKKEHSQNIPPNIGRELFQMYKVDVEKAIGDYIFILATPEIEQIGLKLCENCKHASIDLPYVYFLVNLDLKQVFQLEKGLLGSDHAPFWKAGIPIIFLTDTAGERYPYQHSMADTIDKIDFSQVAKVCKVILSTLIDPSIF